MDKKVYKLSNLSNNMGRIINLNELSMRIKQIEQAMVTKSELNKAIETIAVLSNEDTVRQIISSENDILTGRVKKITSVNEIE